MKKQRFLLFFLFNKPSILAYMYLISQKRSRIMEQCFYVKTSPSAKNNLHPAKMKIDPKSDIHPFCRKAFNWERLLFCKMGFDVT